MSDNEYIALMKRLRPDVIISPDLLRMFKEAYPPNSLKLLAIKAMLGMNEALQNRLKADAEKLKKGKTP